MLDAYGRLPAGLTQGNMMHLGMFDQCVAIAKQLNSTTIKGKYCFPGLIVIPTIIPTITPNISQLDESVSKLLLFALHRYS